MKTKHQDIPADWPADVRNPQQPVRMAHAQRTVPGRALMAAGCLLITTFPSWAQSPPVDSPPANESWSERVNRTSRSAIKFITGQEQDDLQNARRLYQRGDQDFRQAGTLEGKTRRDAFSTAAASFRKAAEAAEGKALAQDALFMQAEALFFADRLNEACDVYQKLQKDYPRNRHNDRAAARLFAISRYWIQAEQADGAWYKVNLTDSSRPRVDSDGHAIRVLDQIRYDDPTGRLADDATMAAAAEYIRQKKYEEADEFLTDLRETFGDSEHQFHAHILGVQCKLEIYRGPRYSGLVLGEAQKIIDQTRRRFPDKLREPRYAEMLAKASARIAYEQSERYMYRANYREKKREYAAAAIWYQRVLDEHGDTPQADRARQRLEVIKPMPAEPAPRMSALQRLFPDSRSKPPLRLHGENAPIPSRDAGVIRR